jgi:hypothetical protein
MYCPNVGVHRGMISLPIPVDSYTEATLYKPGVLLIVCVFSNISTLEFCSDGFDLTTALLSSAATAARLFFVPRSGVDLTPVGSCF